MHIYLYRSSFVSVSADTFIAFQPFPLHGNHRWNNIFGAIQQHSTMHIYVHLTLDTYISMYIFFAIANIYKYMEIIDEIIFLKLLNNTQQCIYMNI